MLSDLREQHALVRRATQSCALVMIDLDRFKEVNDQYGHGAGDSVLISTSECLHAQMRPYDRLYRYGGEEFVLSMPNTTVDTAFAVAERLRAAVEAQEIRHGGRDTTLPITASFGVATLDAARPVEESIDDADKALYEAKSAGRNRVNASA